MIKFWKELNEAYPDAIKLKSSESKPNEDQYFINCESSIFFALKIICFLFQIYKKLFERQIFLSNQIVLLLCTDVIIKEQSVLNPIKVRQIIDGLKKLTKSIIKFIIQNIIETINQIKSEYLLLSHFRQMNSIFDNVSKWLSSENLNLLRKSIKNSSDCETLKYYLEINYSTKAFSKLSSCKIEREKSKIYHKSL